jgi:biopolymer transport protein ExbB
MSRPVIRHACCGLVALALLTFAASGWAQSTGDRGLRSAYEKELSYLEAQRDALEGRLEKLETREASQVSAAQTEVDSLQGRLLGLQTKADRLHDTLAQVERDSEQAGAGGEMVATTVEQANATFDKWGEKIKAPDSGGESEGAPDYAGAITALFDTGTALLVEHQSVRTREGEFFLADGTKTSGDIVKVGNVAAYGVSEQAAGALAPAGDGRLKLWKTGTTDDGAARAARTLVRGGSPEVLDVFLFESLDKAVQEQKDKTWKEVVNSGGVIAWVIVGLGLLGVLLVLGRVLILWRAGANTRSLIGEVGKLVVAGKIEAAKERCQSAKGSAARVLTRTLEHIDVDREELEDVVTESILHELPTLERFGSAILVFAAVAPLLGLLGTVTGMISTFDIITEFGTGDPKMLSGGISEALVTTQLGLIVAIPLLLVGNVLKGWAGNITTHMERGALRLMNLARIKQNLDEQDIDQFDRETRLEDVEMPEAADYLGAV